MFLNRQLLFLFFTLAVSVGYFISAMSLGAPFSDGGLTPSFFPILVGGAAIMFACILILQALRERAGAGEADAPGTYIHLWVVVAIFVYILVFRTVGYFISSGLFVFALIVLFSLFEKLLQKAILTAVIVGLAYIMFQQLFGVRLPTLWG
ncbi:putative tricarboxylic transport membrane protein [Primorskyibacter sedentarius]|uniref:Putative tricarboxylic transport membrane protein n=1 Tax=Primorskyibacter sedentarius TaxID=745311 RepID=A0A4R3JHG1_9RHOB|nr:tripartite tricarboxylate transporter TctB family protein [Primorskyibacter sedentarius]TCS65414.1 putative tricarboxylic transport membrane protein [Primorskyibacter sedentarius]